MKKIIMIIIATLILALGGVVLTSKLKEIKELPLPKVYTYNVDTILPEIKNVHETRQFLAQVLASQSVLLASRFSVDIKKIYVKENDIVKKSQALISLDDTDIRANITSLRQQRKAVKLEVANAKAKLERNEKLLKAEAISQEEYDDSKALYQGKVAILEGVIENIKQFNVQLKYLNIQAPFQGRIGTVFIDEGNLAILGKPIISLNSDDQKVVFSYVPNQQAIIKGQKVFIDNQEVGVIDRLYNDAKEALLVAEVALYKPLPYVNKSYVNIEVELTKMKGCALPLNSLLHKEQGIEVMVYKENMFKPFAVEVLVEGRHDVIVKDCPSAKVARGSEAKLVLLPTMGKLNLAEEH